MNSSCLAGLALLCCTGVCLAAAAPGKDGASDRRDVKKDVSAETTELTRPELPEKAADLLLEIALHSEQADSEDFSVIAKLVLPERDRFPGNRAFRSVALRVPWVYVLDREGGLYVFRLPERLLFPRLTWYLVTLAASILDFPNETTSRLLGNDLKHVHFMDRAGDGNDLVIIGDVLLCTSEGSLVVYGLENPEKPNRRGVFGLTRSPGASQTIVVHRQHLFLIGREGLIAYDVTTPTTPRFLSAAKLDGRPWAGCGSGEYLYLGDAGMGPKARTGISVVDISDPQSPREVGFVATSRSPYHLYTLKDKTLVVCMNGSRLHVRTGLKPRFGWAVNGYVQRFDLADPRRPAMIGETGGAGGRAAALLTDSGRPFLLGDGAVFEIRDRTLEPRFYFWGGSTLDGFPYHGGSEGHFAAIAADGSAIVLRKRGAVDAVTAWLARIIVGYPLSALCQ